MVQLVSEVSLSAGFGGFGSCQVQTHISGARANQSRMSAETPAALAPQPLVDWVRASVAADGAAQVALRLAQEDFLTVQEVCSPSGPNADDLAELFPGQTTVQVSLMNAIKNRQALEVWLRQHLPPGARATAAGCADIVQREDFMSLPDLVSAGLTPTDMAELFPDEPDVASTLLEALQSATASPACAAAASAPASTVTGSADQPSVADSTEAATGSIEAWLRGRLPSIDGSACAHTFHNEGFMNVEDVLSAGLTHADLEELFPGMGHSTLTQLFDLISKDGFTRETPTEQPSKTTPLSYGSKVAPGEHSGTQKPAPLKGLPSSKLIGRPSVGAKIFVQFNDSCYRGKVVSHCTNKASRFDCHFEEDDETWTLDANRHHYCLDKTEAGQSAEKGRRETAKTGIKSTASRAAGKNAPKKRKLPDSDSDDDALSFKRKKSPKRRHHEAPQPAEIPVGSKEDRMSPERETLLEYASSSTSIHRIIAQNAPLYPGCKFH